MRVAVSARWFLIDKLQWVIDIDTVRCLRKMCQLCCFCNWNFVFW